MTNLSLYHNFCIDTFESILSKKEKYSKNFDNAIFKYALKGGLIGQYAETYCINGEEMKFWDIDYNGKKHRKLNEWRVLLASEDAIKGIEEIETGKKEYSKKGNSNCPYYEHIEPKSKIYEKVIKIENPTKQKIIKALQYCKVIMITQKEKDFLDSKKISLFNKRDEEILHSWHSSNYISNETLKESTSSIKKTDGVYISARDNGNAYARLAHLVANGVKFRWICNPNKSYNQDQDVNQGELISQYLENNDRLYSLI